MRCSEFTTKAATPQLDSTEFVPSLYVVGLGPVVVRARVLVHEASQAEDFTERRLGVVFRAPFTPPPPFPPPLALACVSRFLSGRQGVLFTTPAVFTKRMKFMRSFCEIFIEYKLVTP